MDGIKKGDYIQVLDREDGMYWEAIVREMNFDQNLVTVWIPLCKLKMTYHARDVRKSVEERPIQRDSVYKRSDLKLIVRKRKIVFKDGGQLVTGEVKINDPFEAFFHLTNGDLLAYERVVKIMKLSDDEDDVKGGSSSTRQKAKLKSNSKRKQVTELSDDEDSDASYRPKKEKLKLNKKENQRKPRGRPRRRSKSPDTNPVRKSKSPVTNSVRKSKSPVTNPVLKSKSPVTNSVRNSDRAKDTTNGKSNKHDTVSEKTERTVSPVKCKMVDACVDTVDNESFQTVGVVALAESRDTDVHSVAVNSFLPETNTLIPSFAQQIIDQPNLQLSLYNNSVSDHQITNSDTCVSNENAPMANLDFGTTSTSIYYPSTSCGVYPATSSFQCSPSKSLSSLTPGLMFPSTLRENSISYLPYLQDGLQNNSSDTGSNIQISRISDLIEKSISEAKEHSILLRRIKEGQDTMNNYLAQIVQGINEATQANGTDYAGANGNQVQNHELSRSTIQNGTGSGYVQTNNDKPQECDFENGRVNDNGIDLSVQNQYT